MLIDDEVELRRVLVDELLASASAARDAVGEIESAPAAAVHDYRKALRRARAVLRLVAAALPGDDRRAARKGLREARRALGAARDQDVAPEAFASVALGEVEQAAAAAVLDAVALTAPPTEITKQALAEGAARAAAQIDAIVASLPPAIEWATVVDGVRGVFRDARRARKSSKRSRSAFHRWRRRSKELAYQLELLAQHAGPYVHELHRAIETVTDAQGAAVDVIMVRELVLEHGDAAEPDARDRLLETIEEHADALIADARSVGREVFRTKPRKFARALGKAARRDTPPAE
jgi:CHAD domain-containing protein